MIFNLKYILQRPLAPVPTVTMATATTAAIAPSSRMRWAMTRTSRRIPPWIIFPHLNGDKEKNISISNMHYKINKSKYQIHDIPEHIPWKMHSGTQSHQASWSAAKQNTKIEVI